MFFRMEVCDRIDLTFFQSTFQVLKGCSHSAIMTAIFFETNGLYGNQCSCSHGVIGTTTLRVYPHRASSGKVPLECVMYMMTLPLTLGNGSGTHFGASQCIPMGPCRFTRHLTLGVGIA